jgi:hypothetical protein
MKGNKKSEWLFELSYKNLSPKENACMGWKEVKDLAILHQYLRDKQLDKWIPKQYKHLQRNPPSMTQTLSTRQRPFPGTASLPTYKLYFGRLVPSFLLELREIVLCVPR